MLAVLRGLGDRLKTFPGRRRVLRQQTSGETHAGRAAERLSARDDRRVFAGRQTDSQRGRAARHRTQIHRSAGRPLRLRIRHRFETAICPRAVFVNFGPC